MVTRPMQVAVVSGNHIVRAGLVSLVGQMRLHTVVSQAESATPALANNDVAIYDLVSAATIDNADLQHLLKVRLPVIGLVYDSRRHDAPPGVDDYPRLAELASLVDLAAAPAELMGLLEEHGRHQDRSLSEVDLPAGLTEREIQIIEMIASGMSNEAIAKQLYLSINSIKTYIRTAYRKIGVRNRTGAVRWAVEHGLARRNAQ